MAQHGEKTGDLGERLVRHFKGSGFEVFFDHGDKTRFKENVFAIKAFCGDEVTNENRLSDVDVAIVKGDEVVVLAEIEEQASSPKKILGDVMAVFLSNQVAVRKEGEQSYFKLTHDTKFFIVGTAPGKGSRLKKIKHIEKQLQALPKLSNSIDPGNIRLIVDEELTNAISEFEARINLKKLSP